MPTYYLNMRWVVFILIYLSVNLKKKNENVGVRSRHNSAPLQLATSCFLPRVVRYGRGKLPKRKVTV